MPRAEFPDRIKVKRLHFAEFKCEGIVTRDDGSKTRCNAALSAGRVNYDHDNPDGLTGKPTFDNCRALCRLCHADKSKLDAGNIARAKRQEAANLNARPHVKREIAAGPSSLSTKPKRAPRESLPPRSLYR